MAPDDLAAQTLKRRVAAFWQVHGLTASERVRLHVQGGIVTLRGVVFSEREKRLLPACAARVAGVRRVVDRIQLAEAVISLPQPWTRAPLTLLAS